MLDNDMLFDGNLNMSHVAAAGDEEVEIIHAITEYQRSAPSWQWSEIIKDLLVWKEYLIAEFKLHVPELAFCVDKLPAKTMGYYRGGYNGFGLRREIAFNTEYIRKDNFWDVIGTLGHELLHAHQDAAGMASKKRNHHNEEFRDLAASMGLIVNAKGEQTYFANGRFFEFLKSHDDKINLPDMSNLNEPIGQTKKKKGNSTLKKWACDCQNIRSGKGDLFLRCDKPGGCGLSFKVVVEESEAEKKTTGTSNMNIPSPATHNLGNACQFHVGMVPDGLLWDEGLFENVWLMHPADHHEIMMHGKPTKIPRWQEAYGKDYHFSGTAKIALPIPEILMPLTTWVQTNIHAGLNGILMNYYEGPKHHITAHHDSVQNMVKEAPIVTISFGETRNFRLTLEEKRAGKTFIVDTKDFPAPPGTVFVMPYNTNQIWKHGVPKSVRYTGRRISVTFRAFD